MAKTPEERPAMTGASEPPTPETESPRGAPSVKVGNKRIRYNPTPGFRVLVCSANEYGELLSKPKMHVFNFPKERTLPTGRVERDYDQAEYFLRMPKPANVKPIDWWRDATEEELALYEEENGTFGIGPLAEDLRADWKARHPTYREGPPPRADIEAEDRRQRAIVDGMEKLGEQLGERIARRLKGGTQ